MIVKDCTLNVETLTAPISSMGVVLERYVTGRNISLCVTLALAEEDLGKLILTRAEGDGTDAVIEMLRRAISRPESKPQFEKFVQDGRRRLIGDEE